MKLLVAAPDKSITRSIRLSDQAFFELNSRGDWTRVSPANRGKWLERWLQIAAQYGFEEAAE